MRHLNYLGRVILGAATLIGVPFSFGLVAAGGTTAQDSVGRGQASTGRGATVTEGHNLTRPALPNPYRTVENIVTMPPGRTMGSTNANNVDSKGNIWVFERCGRRTRALRILLLAVETAPLDRLPETAIEFRDAVAKRSGIPRV